MLDAAKEPAFARPWTSARISAPPPPASSVVRCAGWTSARSRSARAATREHPLGRIHQRRDRREAVHLRQDDRPPCLRRARETGRFHSPGRRLPGRQARPGQRRGNI